MATWTQVTLADTGKELFVNLDQIETISALAAGSRLRPAASGRDREPIDVLEAPQEILTLGGL